MVSDILKKLQRTHPVVVWYKTIVCHERGQKKVFTNLIMGMDALK